MIKKITTLLLAMSSLFVFAVPAFAHVVVRPNQVGIGSFQTFTMGVPTEKDNPTVGVKLLIPDGLQEVVPNVKAGWTINVVKTGDGDSAKVTEIDWTGGSIPTGQRDDFSFSAQVPATPTTIKWKAYQTYQDGSTVSWDQDPNAMKKTSSDDEGTPFSTTQVINDLTKPVMQPEESHADKAAALLAGAAFILSGIALVFAVKKK